MSSCVDWCFVDCIHWFILKCLGKSKVVHWNEIFDTISCIVSPFVRYMVLLNQSSWSWVRDMEHFLIMRVLLNVEVIIMVNMIVRIINEAIWVIVSIFTLIRVIRKPIFLVV